MVQGGQVIELKTRGADGEARWAYRYRAGGRNAKRIQRGGFASETDARVALTEALERARRAHGRPTRQLTLAELVELVEEYLAQHDVEPGTTAKLRWLLSKALAAFGERHLADLHHAEIAAWRMTISYGHRFEATQALRQVLDRAIAWGLLDTNPAKLGVETPNADPQRCAPTTPGTSSSCSRLASARATDR